MATAKKEELAKGYDCTVCKTHHEFPAYVYANWDFVVDHTCECGALHGIRRGHASLKKKPKKPLRTHA